MKLYILIKSVFVCMLATNLVGGVVIASHKKHNDNVSINWKQINDQVDFNLIKPMFNSESANNAYDKSIHETINKFSKENYSLNDVNKFANNLQKENLYTKDKSNALLNNNNLINSSSKSNVSTKVIKSLSNNFSNKLTKTPQLTSKDYYQQFQSVTKDLETKIRDIMIAAATAAALATVAAAALFVVAVFDFGISLPQAIAVSTAAIGFSVLAIGLSVWEAAITAQIEKVTKNEWIDIALEIAGGIVGALVGIIITGYAIAFGTSWAFAGGDAYLVGLLATLPMLIISTGTLIFSLIAGYKSSHFPIPIIPTPINPLTPPIPWTPVGPSTPVTPWTPINPSIPVTPWTPIGPSTPNHLTPKFNFILFESLGMFGGIIATITIVMLAFILVKHHKKEKNIK